VQRPKLGYGRVHARGDSVGMSCGSDARANETEDAANEFASELNNLNGLSDCQVKAANSASRCLVGSLALVLGIGSTLLAFTLL